MFLLKIPGGLFGAEIEHRLLNVLELNSHCDQCDAIHRYVSKACRLRGWAECLPE